MIPQQVMVVNHVFNFDNDTKCELMNLLQYVVLAIILLVFIIT